MLTFGIVALGVSNVRRATEFWSAALGYTPREDGFGGWSTVLMPPDGNGLPIAGENVPFPFPRSTVKAPSGCPGLS